MNKVPMMSPLSILAIHLTNAVLQLCFCYVEFLKGAVPRNALYTIRLMHLRNRF